MVRRHPLICLSRRWMGSLAKHRDAAQAGISLFPVSTQIFRRSIVATRLEKLCLTLLTATGPHIMYILQIVGYKDRAGQIHWIHYRCNSKQRIVHSRENSFEKPTETRRECGKTY